MRFILLLTALYTTDVATGEIPAWHMIGAPTGNCEVRYDVEDNSCDLVVLSKERIRKKPEIEKAAIRNEGGEDEQVDCE